MKFIVVSDKTIERSIAESKILSDIEKSKENKKVIVNKDDNNDNKVIVNKDNDKKNGDDKVIVNKDDKKNGDTKVDSNKDNKVDTNKDNKVDTNKDNKVDTNKVDTNKVDTNKVDKVDPVDKYTTKGKEVTMKDFTPQNPSGKVIPTPTKPLSDKSPAAKAGIPIEKRQKFANQNAAFQATKDKNSGYSKMDFIKDFPNSQTAKKYNKGERIPGFSYKKNLKNSYDPYHIVLGYVLSEGHADTIDEAHYVMTQMDTDTIQEIVSLDEMGAASKIATGATLTLGAMGLNAIRKMMNNKKTMDQGGQFKKGSTMDNIQKRNQMMKDAGM